MTTMGSHSRTRKHALHVSFVINFILHQIRSYLKGYDTCAPVVRGAHAHPKVALAHPIVLSSNRVSFFSHKVVVFGD